MAKQPIIINEDDIPSNSNTSKIAPIRSDNRPVEENALTVAQKRKRRQMRAKVVVRKKSLVQSIASMFVGSDGDSVGGYILNEVLIPAAKNTLRDMVESGIEMLLYGERRSPRSRDRDRSPNKVSYGSYYKDRDDRRERPAKATYRDKFDLSEIYFENGKDASDALEELCDNLEEFEAVSVADFFDIAGISGTTWAHHKYGWTDLRKAYCTHTRGGYQIVFPDPVDLD